MIPASFVSVGYLNASINRTSRRTMIPQLCFDVRLCQKFPDRYYHALAPPALIVGILLHSWSVDEHDPSAIQLKLVGNLDSVVRGCLQMRPTSAVYELQLQSLECEMDQTDCPPYCGFPTPNISYHTTPKGWPTQTEYRRIDHVRDKRRKFSDSSRGEALSSH